MGEIASFARVHVIEGRPWKDAIISVLEPRSPYRPWHTAGGIEPGDAVITGIDLIEAANELDRWGEG